MTPVIFIHYKAQTVLRLWNQRYWRQLVGRQLFAE